MTKAVILRFRLRDNAGGSWMLSPLRDLSSSGARFLCEQNLGVGTLLEGELVLPSAAAPVPVYARIVRAQSVQAGLTEHGVVFEELSIESAARVNQVIAHSLKKEKE